MANGFVFVSGQAAVRPGGEAYAEFFPGPKPARAIARLGVEIPGVLISIEATAAL